MNYGRFFTLDVNASQLSDGIAVFNYRGLKKKHINKDNVNFLREKYPIYVTFTEEGVSFHIHDYEEIKTDGIDEFVTKHHTNSLILSLPISTNLDIKDNLTSNLNEIFFNKYPHNGKENTIYNHAVDSLVDFHKKKDKGVTYSLLEIFGINYSKPTNEPRPPIVGFLRKLFLDFLYDLEHTSIFRNAARFESTYIALNENFLFKAIRNKAEYYYQRKLASQIQRSLDSGDKELFLADFFVNAETNWLETITDPRAVHYFHNSKWFNSAEDELDSVYISKRIGYNKKIIAKSKSLRCYDFVRRIRWGGINACREEGVQNIRDNRNYFKKQEYILEDQIISNAKEASEWYLHKYNFGGTVKIWFGTGFSWRSVLLFLMLMALVFTIISPSFHIIIIGDDELIPPLLIFGFLILCWFIHLRKKIGRVGGINIFMPRLFAAIVTAWFTLAIGEDIFKGFFDNIFNGWVSTGLLLVTLMFVVYEIQKINPFIRVKDIFMRSIALIVIAFVYSFMIGLLVVHAFGEKYLERSDYIDEFYINNIYIQNPLYGMKNIPKHNHELFYETLHKYNDTIVKEVLKINLACSLVTKDSVRKYLEQEQSMELNKDTTNIKIKYGITLFLIKEFARPNRDLDVYEQVMDGTTVSRRIEHLAKVIKAHTHTQDTIWVCDSILNNLNLFVSQLDADSLILEDKSWISLIRSINNHAVYSEVLASLEPKDEKGEFDDSRRFIFVESEILGINIFRDLLLQFAFFAMFIGIFLQLIFEEKSVTEPV